VLQFHQNIFPPVAVKQTDLDQLRSEGDINISARRAAWSRSNIDTETQRWLEADASVFLHQSLSTPCLNVLKGCDGALIEDLAGHRYLDFHGNNVHQVGFSHPKVIEAITRQMQELSFCTRRYTNIPAIQLAEKLAALAPGDLKRVLFTPGGTSAIGMAIKLARAATGRFKTISMWDAFHGASLDAISLGGEAIFRQNAGPLLPGCEHVPPANPRRCPFKCGDRCNLSCADYIEYVLEKEGDIAAVVAETVRSVPYIPPPDYWKRVRAACDKHGALLILDEIPTALGRTGKMFAIEHYGIVPDMLVIGKGLGGGIFPLAALIAREHLNVAGEKALGHYTHEKNPVACAAALAAIEVVESEDLLQCSTTLGERALAQLRAGMASHPLISDIRGLGLLLGVELASRDRAEVVMYQSLSQGLNFKLSMGTVCTLTPALNISEADLDRGVSILLQAIKTAESAPCGE
jgi:4-aminobutyrate aminotransferase